MAPTTRARPRRITEAATLATKATVFRPSNGWGNWTPANQTRCDPNRMARRWSRRSLHEHNLAQFARAAQARHAGCAGLAQAPGHLLADDPSLARAPPESAR